MRPVMFLTAILLLLSCSLTLEPTDNPIKHHHRQIDGEYFIVFANDGTLYKLNAKSQEAEWYATLPFKLLSIDFEQISHQENETQLPNIIIPTLDGDFVYIEKSYHPELAEPLHKQILIERQDVEVLLDMCFVEQNSMNKHQYFVYENFEYFVLNIHNGDIIKIEDFFKAGNVLNKSEHAIIFIDQKLLKQTTTKLQVRWSVISSKINLMSVGQFAKNYHKQVQDHQTTHKKYLFERLNSKIVNIKDKLGNSVFEIETNSAILSIFGWDEKNFRQMKVMNVKPHLLALEDKSMRDNQSYQIGMFNQNGKPSTSNFEDFPYSQLFTKKDTLHKEDEEPSDIQVCIAAQKVIKEMSGEKDKKFVSSFYQEKLPTIPYSTDRPLEKVIVAKQQPYVIYFLFATLCLLGFGFYRIKVNKLWQQMSEIETIHDEKWKNLASKMGQFQEIGKAMKRMYEVNWDDIIQRNKLFLMFSGRFLNKPCYVYTVPLAGVDIIGIEIRLNNLFGSSHKAITKLYYYTRNDDSLLIFIEKNESYKVLREMTPQDFNAVSINQQKYKENIKLFIEVIKYLEHMKMEILAFSEDSWLFQPESLNIKINMIPSLLERQNQQVTQELNKLGVSRIRLNMVEIIHKFGHLGVDFDLLKFEKEKNTEEEQNFFLKDFYDFVLTDEPPNFDASRKGSDQIRQIDPEKETKEQIIKEEGKQNLPPKQVKEPKEVKQAKVTRDIASHPFLWDSKHCLLFISEFSNYAQTYIDESKNIKMQTHCKNMHIVPFPWAKQFPSILVKEINNYRKYDFYSVRDLIRLIRNKLNHYHEMPKETKAVVGKTPELFLQYCMKKFPKLLPFMYMYASKKKWKLNIKL